jgi:hypothetical protein
MRETMHMRRLTLPFSATFSTFTQNVTLQSTSTPMVIYLRDEIDVYDYNVYIQRISLASITPNSSTSSTVSDDTTNELQDIAKHEITLVAVAVLVPTAVIILLMACCTLWWLRRQKRRLLQGGARSQTGVTPPDNQILELQPQTVSPRTRLGSSASHLPLDLQTVNSERRSVELPSTPLEPTPPGVTEPEPEPEPDDTRSRPSIIDDPIGQYAAIYRNKISRQLEEKLRAASFMPYHDPNSIPGEAWRELNVGPFELERLKEIFGGYVWLAVDESMHRTVS